MPKLILYPGSDDQSELDLDGRESVALGRSDRCDIVVRRRMASRTHALVEKRDGRYFIRDVDSYNGTFVNNRQVRDAQLVHGDEIRIANRVFRFLEFTGSVVEAEPGDTLRLHGLPMSDELLEVAHDDLEGADQDLRDTPADPLRTVTLDPRTAASSARAKPAPGTPAAAVRAAETGTRSRPAPATGTTAGGSGATAAARSPVAPTGTKAGVATPAARSGSAAFWIAAVAVSLLALAALALWMLRTA